MRLQSKFDIYNTKIKGSLATQPSNPAKYQKQATTMKDVSKVYILLHTDPNNSLTTSVLGVFASLQDANDECLSQARAAGVTLETEYPSMGPNKEHIIPVQPARWDTAEGTSCWVEAFEVTPQRVKSPDVGAFQ